MRELKDSEERYHFLFNKMLNGFALHEIICDEAGKPVDYRFLEVNQAFEKLIGLRSNDIIGKTVLQVLPDTEQYWIDTYGRVALTGEPMHLENYAKELDKYYEVTAYSHKKGFFAVIFADVTERKKTEAVFRALTVSNVGTEFFHETVSSLCTWLGVECVIIGELVDENKVQALAMQVDGKAVEHYEYALAGTPCESATKKGYCEYHEGVVQLFPADKDLVDIRAEAYVGIPVRDKNGKVNGILCAISRHKFVPPPMVKEVLEIIAARVGVEIERKKAEEALRETSSYLESLINYANAPIIVWNPTFRITRFNHAFEHLTGYKADEVVGKELGLLFPEVSREDSMDKIIRTSGGEFWESVEIPIIRKDGNIRLSLWNSANIYVEDGKTIMATIAQGQDITERKKAEEKIKEQLDYLERFQKVAVKREFRIKDLRDENDRLKARIEETEKKFKS